MGCSDIPSLATVGHLLLIFINVVSSAKPLDLQEFSTNVLKSSVVSELGDPVVTFLNRAYGYLGPSEPECFMTAPEIVRHLGYTAEVHSVKTKDGYILELHRIPYGKVQDHSGPRVPVLLQHGLDSSSDDWIVNLANQSLSYMLADYGYDVWMGNVRGNKYSNKHESMNITERGFWKFSYDEMAKYDVPAMIDYILELTTRKQLYYVGYSMGTTMAFAMLSSNHKYDNKIKAFIAITPVATIANVKGLAKVVYPSLGPYIQSLVSKDEPPAKSSNLLATVGRTFCAVKPTNDICLYALNLLAGPASPAFNKTRLPIILSHYSSGSSLQTLSHYLQNINKKSFRQYDYGNVNNLIKYHQVIPPLYDISKINVPTALLSGLNDYLSTPEDMLIIAKQLPKLIKHTRIDDYNHFDFGWSTDTGTRVTQHVLSWMDPNV